MDAGSQKKVLLLSAGSLLLLYILSTMKNNRPMNWIAPIKNIITSKFGQRGDHFHNGIDIRAKEGTPVLAPRSGVVLNIYKTERGGLQMIVEHDNKYRTGYAHLSKTILKQGDFFKQGDILALTGKTGQLTGEHLHFTLTDPAGNKVDPETLIYKT